MGSERLRAYFGYFRGLLLRLRGARIAFRTRVDRNCHFQNPAGLETGARTHLEQNATIKIVTLEGTVVLGEQVFIGRNSTLDISERLVIGARTLVAPGCFITDHNHRIAVGERIVDQGTATRPVEIGEDAWIGANVCILSGVRIGDGAVIGAGAVVTKDVPANCIAAGVPARVVRERSAT